MNITRRTSRTDGLVRGGRDQGFTLVELLVVVIIIGVLAAIAIPVYLNQRKKAVDASLKSDLKNAALAARTVADEGPFANYESRPELGLPSGFNPGGWGPAGTQTPVGLFAFHDMRVTGEDHWSGWRGNRLHVGGLPAPGQWQLCAWHPSASTATSRTTAMGYDEAQGGLIGQINCEASAPGGWTSITRWYDGGGNPALSY